MSGADRIGYEEAKRQARGTPDERRRLAADPETRPEILYFLAEDEAAEVRREIARNDKTPLQATRMLATDRDEDVRLALVEKLARLTPTLSVEERAGVYEQIEGALETLARDQLAHVRQVLATALKDLVEAPIEVVRRLAHDEELSVCGPVLEYSPLLSDEDLLEIVACTTTAGAHAAISRRHQVSSTVSDAIVRTGDTDAIADLLANNSAQIREETLDHIIDQASQKPRLHAPLVRRPKLSSKAVLRIAEIVADKLLEELNGRLDLDQATQTALANVVQTRLRDDSEQSPASNGRQLADPDWAESSSDSKVSAEELFRTGKLTEGSIADALLSGDKRFAMSALSLTTGVAEADIASMLSSHNPKGIVALVWKAKFSMDLAVRLQMQLGGIPPGKTLRGRSRGGYPLSVEEMEWQIEFMTG